MPALGLGVEEGFELGGQCVVDLSIGRGHAFDDAEEVLVNGLHEPEGGTGSQAISVVRRRHGRRTLHRIEGVAQTVASYVPPFSIVLMPIRVLNGDAAVWEPVVALALLVLAMAATVVFAERIYRRALLQTQGGVTLKQAWTATD